MNVKEGKTEFDLRQALLKQIGKFTQQTALTYRNALRNKSKANLQEYFYELKALFRCIKRYSDTDDEEQQERIKNIKEEMEEFSEKLGEGVGTEFHILEDNLQAFKDLEKLDDEVQKLRMEVGLDIPRKKEYDPEDAGVAGLN